MTSQVLTKQASRLNLSKGLALAVASNGGTAALTARLGLAIVMFPHGAQKVLGWFGGYGWSGTYGFFTEQMGLPGIVAASVMLIEFFGPLLLIAGLAVRPIALAFVGLMIGTIVTVTGSNGFFMNWTGQQSGEGIEYALLAITIALSLVFSGAGKWSLDTFIHNKLE